MRKKRVEAPAQEAKKKECLFLLAGFESIRQPIEYLRKRDWKVSMTVSLKEAVGTILKTPPDFFFISANCKAPMIMELPKVLKNTNCIFIGEKHDFAANNRLRSTDSKYVLFPPITGPALERMIYRIERDVEIKSAEISGMAMGGQIGDNKEHVIRIKSGTGEDGAYVAGSHEANLLSMILNGSAGDGQDLNQGASVQGVDPNWKVADESIAAGQFFEQSGGQAPGSRERESILEKGVKTALAESVVLRGEPKGPTSDKTKRVASFSVRSLSYRGYILAAFTSEGELSDELIGNVHKRLLQFMAEFDTNTEIGENIDIQLQNVNFEAWASEHSEFLKKAQHMEDEVMMAFFPVDENFSKVEVDEKLKKLEVDIHELRGDLIVEFDLFLHLPTNQRLIKYTGKGLPFYDTQRSRLASRGIEKMYVQEEALKDLKKYRLQNYLNDRIQEFEDEGPERKPKHQG